MGIGPGIVTKSARRPKYKLGVVSRGPAHPAQFHYRRKYLMITKQYRNKTLVDFAPKFSIKEQWKTVRHMWKELPEEEMHEFYRALCDRHEGLGLPVKPHIDQMVDDFIRLYPRWTP